MFEGTESIPSTISNKYFKTYYFPIKIPEGKSLRFYGTSLDVENFLKGYCVLVSSGNYTQVEILTGNSWEKFINYKVLRQESNLRLCDAGALLWPLIYGGSWPAAPASHRRRSIPAGGPYSW